MSNDLETTCQFCCKKCEDLNDSCESICVGKSLLPRVMVQRHSKAQDLKVYIHTSKSNKALLTGMHSIQTLILSSRCTVSSINTCRSNRNAFKQQIPNCNFIITMYCQFDGHMQREREPTKPLHITILCMLLWSCKFVF